MTSKRQALVKLHHTVGAKENCHDALRTKCERNNNQKYKYKNIAQKYEKLVFEVSLIYTTEAKMNRNI